VKLNIIDEFGHKTTIDYTPYEYDNLMELVVNELWEEWGDCLGRAMCGTCHIEILNGKVGEKESFEAHTIDGLPNKTKQSRLACQIIPDQSINDLTFKILKDY